MTIPISPDLIKGLNNATAELVAARTDIFAKRPLVDLSIICRPIPGLPLKPLCLTLPGGLELCTNTPRVHFGLMEYAKAAVGMANQALAPMVPLFRVIDAVLSIGKCLVMIPEMIGPPPRLDKFIEELAKLAQKMLLVARLAPLFSVPVMILQVFDMVITTVAALASEIESLGRFAAQIQRAQINATQAPGLLQLIKCAEGNQAQMIENLEHAFALINPLIDVLNLLAQIVDLGDPFPIQSFRGNDFTVASDAAAKLREIVTVLSTARSKIPL